MSKKETTEFSRMPLVQFFKDLFLNDRFFYAMFGMVVLFVLSFIFPSLLLLSKFFLFVFIALVLVDVFILFRDKKGIIAARNLPDKFSNGDFNEVPLEITNTYGLKMYCVLIDELPMQFQLRDFKLSVALNAAQKEQLTYTVRPTERGEYV